MIARDGLEPPGTEPPTTSPISAWIAWWQRALSHLLSATTRSLGRVAARAREARLLHAIGERSRSLIAGAKTGLRRLPARFRAFVEPGLRHRMLPYVGVVAIVAGAAFGVLIASPGIGRRAAMLAGAASLMWTAIRWVALRFRAPGLVPSDERAVRGAFSLGLLAYAVALTPELRLAAWVAAAAITGVALIRLGRPREEVVRTIGFAWGVQALVVTLGWLAKNAYVAIVTMRG